METKNRIKYEWRVWAVLDKSLPTLYIKAETFDKAIAEARKVSTQYCAAQINKHLT